VALIRVTIDHYGCKFLYITGTRAGLGNMLPDNGVIQKVCSTAFGIKKNKNSSQPVCYCIPHITGSEMYKFTIDSDCYMVVSDINISISCDLNPYTLQSEM